MTIIIEMTIIKREFITSIKASQLNQMTMIKVRES